MRAYQESFLYSSLSKTPSERLVYRPRELEEQVKSMHAVSCPALTDCTIAHSSENPIISSKS